MLSHVTRLQLVKDERKIGFDDSVAENSRGMQSAPQKDETPADAHAVCLHLQDV